MEQGVQIIRGRRAYTHRIFGVVKLLIPKYSRSSLGGGWCSLHPDGQALRFVPYDSTCPERDLLPCQLRVSFEERVLQPYMQSPSLYAVYRMRL